MAKDNSRSLDQKREDLQNQEGGLDPQPQINSTKYNPNKKHRAIRRQVYERYYWLRDEPARHEAEADWEIADKEYNMYTDPVDPLDWRSHIQLPDAFAAIQAQAQETIERKARPTLLATEESDEPMAEFANSIIHYNMNSTGYDYQYALAKLSASIRGTAFVMDYWRTDKRIVKYPDSVDEETGEIKYVTKEITDFDDDYTEWVPNEFIYIDEKADHIDNANDMFRREILNIEDFHRLYDNKPGFYDTEWVFAGGDTSDKSFFKLPGDITHQDVEILHYSNRAIDAYWVVANNVNIFEGPLPTPHKELPIGVVYQYRVPGRFWGIGIPKVVHNLSEERKSIRNLNMDRQKIIVGGAFLHNNAYDIDDEDETLYPGKWISIDTQGQPISQAIQPLNVGDVPSSYFRTEEILLEDIRRAHGIDDRIQGVQAGGTATEAAILKESALKRVNMISIQNEMDFVIRIGRLKWANIQFYYTIPRMEKIADEDGGEKTKKIHRTITADGKKFSIISDNGKTKLDMEDIKGSSALQLKSAFHKYIESSYDITVNADVFTPISKAIEQTKKTEIFGMLLGNPATSALLDLPGAMSDVMRVNNIKPDVWMKNNIGRKDMMMLAESENMVMAAGQPLSGTEGATEDHTLVHLMFTKTQEFNELPPEFKQLIADHLMQEHDNNPATGQIADMMGQYGMGAQTTPGAPGVGLPVPPPGLQANTSQPQAQVADIQPTNFAQPE
jgi:hypothetical protein